MVQNTAEQLTEQLLDRLDGGLRTVVIVKESGHEIAYLREDLRDTYSEETFTEVVDTFRLDQPFMSPGIDDRPVGERRAVVHYHEDAFVLQFPFSDTESILISLARETGRDLLQFIDYCREIVHKNQ